MRTTKMKRGVAKPLLARCALYACIATVSQQSMAQITSATVNGAVVDQSGNAISGATVTIVHEPTAATKSSTSGDRGSFFQSGMRVGGPYTITIKAPGYREQQVEDLYFQPGSQPVLRLRLEREGSAAIEEVLVTAQAMGSDIANGVGSDYSAEDISNQPATKRDLIRTLIRDPLANSQGEGNLSVAGVNPRFNGLSIDGSLQQDDFGLGSNTYATARSPINLDAVESASLLASDYSVIISGFTGGLVNVTTKSGTNEWDGSAFYYYQDESFIGDTFAGDQTFEPGEFEEKEYGVTLGGPIIKDRLFFFASYDEYESASASDFRNFDENNGIQPGFFDALRQLTIDTYDYDPGTRPGTANTPVTSERLLTKIDWNINADHRASFTYQSTEEFGTSVGGNELQSAWYDIPVDLKAYTAQLFSDWTPNLSTTLRANFKEFERGQICRAGPDVGAIELNDLDPETLAGTPLDGLLTRTGVDIVMGCDRFRHANDFSDERLQLFASADYQAGDHLITMGGEWEEFELFNVFVQSSRGRYRFFDFQDFLNRDATVEYLNANSNNAADGAAEWGYDKLALFLQDTWQVSDVLEVTLGMRYEQFVQDDKPQFSADVLRDYGVNSSNNLDGADLWLPRVGFRWDAAPRTTVTGGFGRFAGGEPKVWISNAFQPITVFARGDFSNVDPFNVPMELQNQVAAGTGIPIDVISEDFELPSDWKASLRVDQQFDAKFGGINLGEDYFVTAQYLYTQMEDGFLWRNLSQTTLTDAQPLGVAPDGRPIYADLSDLGILNVTELGNASGAESHVLSFSLGKRFDNGFEFQIGYAYQDVETVAEGTSSRGISSWRGITSPDRNNPQARTSPFQIEHAFKFNFAYERELFAGLNTRIDLFGQLLHQGNYTPTFDVSNSNSLFGRAGAGENPFDNNPLYIPTGAGDSAVVYAEGFDRDGFLDWIDRKGLGSGIAEVNGETASWTNIWDLRIQQELPGIPGMDRFVGENRFKLQLDIENVLNLINDEWGQFNNGPGNNQSAIVRADLVSAADLAANGVDGAIALTGDAPRTTCVSSGDCVYRYNTFRDLQTGFTSPSNSVYRIRLGIRMDF
ncbi:TonB-dependent receptor [Chromatocurvus halotolerans]|uniref:Carboxypeptidase family protein n=1 Tax=Chromatocurvus halotolerans TaxID=1132028 RepID=A0A4V2SBE1_9GAMM|nr:TonB-dependent receptor [Chromatocurvus halotolerans]TCO74890.1 carboxypeptidase family protein [Chromatocurvus halotolerans]